MKKRILAMLLSLCMVVGLLPTAVFAESLTGDESPNNGMSDASFFTYTISSDTVIITGLNTTNIMGADGVTADADGHYNINIIIPAAIDGKAVTVIGESAFYTGSNSGSPKYDSHIRVQSIDLSGATNLETINSNAFYNYLSTSGTLYTELSGELILPNSLKTIGSNAFTKQPFTGDLTIPDSVESIGSGAFQDCGFDGKLTLPTNENYTTIESQLFLRTPITSLVMPENQITEIQGSAFNYSELTGHFDIPEGVTTIGPNVFAYSTLDSLSFPSSIENLSYLAFSNLINTTFVVVKFSFEDVNIVTGTSSFTDYTGTFWNSGSENSNFSVILTDKDSYDAIYSNTFSSHRTYLTYPLTLTFDGLASSYDREVLYNRAINLQEDGNGITWSADESYALPTLETGMRWSFTNANALVTDTIITAESNVAGDTLYAVAEENVSDYYTYFAFGSYPQTQLGSLSKGTMTDEEFSAAILEREDEYEAEGIEVYRFESSDTLVYWFKMEPILWRQLATATSEDTTAYRLWSEYVIDQEPIGENKIYTGGFTSTPLYSWLQGDFKETAFAEYEQEFITSITLMNHSDFRTIYSYYGANHLKAFKSDFANYIGSSTHYWLNYTYGNANYSLIGYNTTGVNTSSNSYGSQYNYIDTGIRPDIEISIDTTNYTTTGTGTFDDPYIFVAVEDAEAPTITSDLSTSEVTYTQDAVATALDGTATVSDGGTVTYQWYSNTTNSTEGSSEISGATSATYTPATSITGTTYYYVVATNTNGDATGDTTSSTTSSIAMITVNTKGSQTAITFDNENIVTVGETLTLVTTAGAEVSGDVTYTLAEGDTAATLSDGVLTGVSAGMVTVTATKVGDENYNDVTATMTVFVIAVDGSVIAAPTIEDDGATIRYTGGSSDTFDITAVDAVTETEKTTLETELPSGYTADGTFHIYALVNDIVVEDATFSTAITITMDYPVESGKIYQVLHLKSDNSVETLSATPDVVSQKLSFNVSELSAFMVVSVANSSSSGSSSVSYYTSTVASTDNGTVSLSSTSSKLNATVTITVTPDDGYEVGTVTVTNASDTKLTATDNGDGTYSYKQPGSAVTVTVTFVEIGSETEGDGFFTDVDEDDWFYDAVLWAVDAGITTGATDTTFAPELTCSRAQAVTFLWRAAGEPVVDCVNPFADVDADSYYYDAVLWAVSEGITAGTSETTFEPDAVCSRSQIVTFLYRFAGEPDVAGDCDFGDVDTDSYYYNAVLWAVENGITSGTSNTTFSPDENCTRAEIVTFLYRISG